MKSFTLTISLVTKDTFVNSLTVVLSLRQKPVGHYEGSKKLNYMCHNTNANLDH